MSKIKNRNIAVKVTKVKFELNNTNFLKFCDMKFKRSTYYLGTKLVLRSVIISEIDNDEIKTELIKRFKVSSSAI